MADLLGHSSIAVTGDIYGHTSDDAARAAVEGLTDQLGLADFETALLYPLLYIPRDRMKKGGSGFSESSTDLHVLWSG